MISSILLSWEYTGFELAVAVNRNVATAARRRVLVLVILIPWKCLVGGSVFLGCSMLDESVMFAIDIGPKWCNLLQKHYIGSYFREKYVFIFYENFDIRVQRSLFDVFHASVNLPVTQHVMQQYVCRVIWSDFFVKISVETMAFSLK